MLETASRGTGRRAHHLAHDEAEDLAEVEASDHLLERLLSGLVGRLVNRDVVAGSREVLVRGRVERAPDGAKSESVAISSVKRTERRAHHSQLMAI